MSEVKEIKEVKEVKAVEEVKEVKTFVPYKAIVKCSTLFVYASPSYSSEIVDKCSRGDCLQVTDEKGNFAKVKSGWVGKPSLIKR